MTVHALIDEASVIAWREHDEQEISSVAWDEHDEHDVGSASGWKHAAFEIKVARWKTEATQQDSAELEIDAEILDPPRVMREDWHVAYVEELLACPAFAWRFASSLNAVYVWAHLSKREIKAIDLWLMGENQENIGHAIEMRKSDVKPFVLEAFEAIRERISNSGTGPVSRSTRDYARFEDLRPSADGSSGDGARAGHHGPGSRGDLLHAAEGAGWLDAGEPAA